MNEPQTLKTLLAAHPDWGDLPLVIYTPDGFYDWVGGAGAVYQSHAKPHPKAEAVPVLVFAPN